MCDTLFGSWTGKGIFFVTRLKENAVFEMLEERPIPKGRNWQIEIFFKTLKQTLTVKTFVGTRAGARNEETST